MTFPVIKRIDALGSGKIQSKLEEFNNRISQTLSGLTLGSKSDCCTAKSGETLAAKRPIRRISLATVERLALVEERFETACGRAGDP